MSKLRRMLRYVAFGVLSPLALLLRVLGIRVLPAHYAERIGHLVAETYAAQLIMDHGAERVSRVFSAATIETSANPEVFRRLPGVVRTLPRLLRRPAGLALSRHPLTRLNTDSWVAAIGGPAEVFKYGEEFSRAGILREELGDAQALRVLRSVLGVGLVEPFVCLHIREAGYATEDDSIQDYRNSRIADFVPAVEWLVAQGLKVVRMGGGYASPFPPIDGLIDYARSDYVSPLNDLLLTKSCRYFIGGTSGLHILAGAHGVPIAGVDMAPMSAFGLFGSSTVSIPKLYYRKGASAPMSFSEALQAPQGDFRFASQFDEAGIEVRNNRPEEILELIQEVHSRTLGDWIDFPEDLVRQQRFRECVTDTSYSRYASTLIGSAFLRRHESLLPPVR